MIKFNNMEEKYNADKIDEDENMEKKTFKTPVPIGYEIDENKSTLYNIVYKRKQDVLVWEDLIGKDIPITSSFIDTDSFICNHEEMEAHQFFEDTDENIFINEKHAKCALAISKISQLMPYYGGAITNKEWNSEIMKYCIARDNKGIIWPSFVYHNYHFLAFRSEKLRILFDNYNHQLVKDYLMID